jgi:hypothetical protein
MNTDKHGSKAFTRITRIFANGALICVEAGRVMQSKLVQASPSSFWDCGCVNRWKSTEMSNWVKVSQSESNQLFDTVGGEISEAIEAGDVSGCGFAAGRLARRQSSPARRGCYSGSNRVKPSQTSFFGRICINHWKSTEASSRVKVGQTGFRLRQGYGGQANQLGMN